MTRSPLDNELLAREYRLIHDLRERGSAFLRATVPGPLFTTLIADHLIGLEAYLLGQPMDGLLGSTKRVTEIEVRKYLDLAINWLLCSQQETAPQDRPLSEEQVRDHFIVPVVRLRELARLTSAEKKYLERLVKRLTALTEYPLPLRFNHGDFQPGNIFVTGSSVHVIDWEFGSLTGLPLMDVFSFLARAYARCHGLEEIDGKLEDYFAAFEAVFIEGGAFAGIAAEYVTRVCQGLRIHPVWIGVLFPLFFVTEAIKYHTFLSQRANRGYVYLLHRNHSGNGKSYVRQLARQKNVWLLRHLMRHEERLIFNHLG